MAKVRLNKVEVVSKDSNDNVVTVYVKRPSREQVTQAQILAGKVLKQALDGGALLRDKLDGYMRENNLWNDAKDAEFKELNDKLNRHAGVLAKGGIKKSEAKKIALEMRKLRFKQAELLALRGRLDEYTAESQAENAKFNYLVSVSVVDAEDKNIFEDVNDYHSKMEEPYAYEAAAELGTLMNDIDKDWEKKLPENRFLYENNFVNDKLQLVNKDGKLVDVDGRLINDDGRYINDDGEFVDVNGSRVNEDGSPVLTDALPFLED